MINGFILALLSAFLLSLNTFYLGKAGLLFGKKTTTFIVLVMGMLLNIVANLVCSGNVLSNPLTRSAFVPVAYLLMSGFLGYFLSYTFLLMGGKHIGMPRTTLIGSFSIFIVSILGKFFLQETFTLYNILWGSFIIVGIIATFDIKCKNETPKKDMVIGILASVMLALCQAISILLIKSVLLTESMSPIDINIIRLIPGIVVSFVLYIIRKKVHRNRKFTRANLPIILYLFLAAFFGPFLSVLFLNSSLLFINASVTNAILQLSPIFILFLTAYSQKERISLKVFLGCLCAIFGATMFSFV